MKVLIDTEKCEDLSIPLMFYFGLYEACGMPETVSDFYESAISGGYNVKYDTLYRACRKLSDRGYVHYDFESATRGQHLYLIVDEDKYYLKIGVSDKPKMRLKSLQTANPRKLILVCVKRDMAFMESKLHKRFDCFRKSGEWFEYNDEIVKTIEKL